LLLDDFKHIGQEYEAAKNHVLTGLGTYDRVVDMPSFQDSNTTLGEELKEMVSDWELQRKPFCPLPLDTFYLPGCYPTENRAAPCVSRSICRDLSEPIPNVRGDKSFALPRDYQKSIIK
jgi:hypothetical protein